MTITKDKVALITGAARGIGLAIAARLARDARCILVDTSSDVTEATDKLPNGALGVVADVSDETEVANVFARIWADYGRLDILVNNAGIHPRGTGDDPASLDAVTLADWDRVLGVNLTSMFIVTRAALPIMRCGGYGRVINMSSRTARGFTGTASVSYTVSKAGVIALTRQIAGTEGRYGITANCIAPGSVRTPMAIDDDEDGIAARAARTVVGRIGEPEDIAAIVAFLASDESGYITGATIDVNGGASMS